MHYGALCGAIPGVRFLNWGPNPIAAPEKHAHNTAHIVTLFADRALLAEIEIDFVRFPDTLLRLGSLYRFFGVWALLCGALCGASFWSSFSELGPTR